MMKAYRIEKFDGLNGIVAASRPDLTPGVCEVVVRARARTLNYRDLLILKKLYPVAGVQGVVPLSDGAGEVVAVGEKVTRVAVGDRVAATYFPRWQDGRLDPTMAAEQFGCTRDGMLAEFVLAPEQALVKLPAHLSFEEGATLPCAGVTAWSAVTGPRPILPGETVLTIGTGGVALFALQFAKMHGAWVISLTSSSAKADLLRKAGADEVVDYTANVEWEKAVRTAAHGRGVDHVIETGAINTLPRSLASCAPDGQVALVAALGTGTLDAAALRGLVSIRRVFVGSRAAFEAMNRAISLHKMHPIIDRVFRFGDAKDAYAHFEGKKHVGKVVIGDT
jgi:NADPH:quinone reductase-like Zn-dependent oxidoreductase